MIGYHESLTDEFALLPRSLISPAGDVVTHVDGVNVESDLRIFVHSPFKKYMEDTERNRTSIGLHLTLLPGGSRAMLLGDLDYEPVKQVFEYTKDLDNKKWDVFLAPHHCSKSVMYERISGKDFLRRDVLRLIEGAKASDAWIVSSSGPIPASNSPGDNPPHAKAKKPLQRNLRHVCLHRGASRRGQPCPTDLRVDYGRSLLSGIRRHRDISRRGASGPGQGRSETSGDGGRVRSVLRGGQRQALGELRIISEAGNSIELVDYETTDNGGLNALISLDTRFPHAADGIKFRARERLNIEIPETFPWHPPSVWVPHLRWAGRPHVNYGLLLCLYLAPDVEWNPSDGMFGLVDRLVEWLRRAAINDLDPEAAPLHPPYAPVGLAETVIVRDDTPQPQARPWFGFASVERRSSTRVELRGWFSLEDDAVRKETAVAAVVLSHRELPYEYPTRLGPFIQELNGHGVTKELLMTMLRRAAHHNRKGTPLYVVVGTPMRGTKGGERRQHIAVWRTSSTEADSLRLTVPMWWDTVELGQHRSRLLESMMAWADSAKISWCSVDEARPEVTRPRGGDSPMTNFAGRSVAILGCGAIGSHLAEYLARADVTEFTLVDDGCVSTGNLPRQLYEDQDLTEPKSKALAHRLERINPAVQVVPCVKDAVQLAGDEASPIWRHDIIIDATANQTVAKRLEATRPRIIARPWLIRMLLGHRANRGLLTVAPPCNVGGSPRLVRRAKLTAVATKRLAAFAVDFWPDPPRTDLFLPEPGCSAPTFVGAEADVAAVVGALTRSAGTALASETAGSWMMIQLPDGRTGALALSEHQDIANPVELEDACHGYSVQVEPDAMAELLAWIRKNDRNFPDCETGGHLYGEIDNATRTIAVTAALGPPPDSEASPRGFRCGTVGVDNASAALHKLGRGTHRPIGMWHTHPRGNPAESPVDNAAMMRLTTQQDRPLPQQLLLIAGGNPTGSRWNAYFYDSRPSDPPTFLPTTSPTPIQHDNRGIGQIGLALSGGGLRAAAFHLGCLRALNDRDLLDQVSTVSAVSGGSLVAAQWAYTQASFEEFDYAVLCLLRQGLWKSTIRHWLDPSRLAGAIKTSVKAGLLSLPNAFLGEGGPLPRTTSSVHALEAAIRETITDAQISQVTRDGLNVIINACDLRTGAAFRFGNIESGSWRDGTIKHNRVSVAKAVAASAAYPLAFPAYDLTETFVRRDGTEHQRRVILTDGGVYDNLGTSPLLPNRTSTVSTNVHGPHEWIIACDAGRGLFDGSSRPYWYVSRLRQSFDSTYRKAQNSDRAALFNLNDQEGPVRGVVVAMLGMNDANLPVPISDIVRREQVIGIKTNLSALSDGQIELLTRRGEQIIGALVAHYGPHR